MKRYGASFSLNGESIMLIPEKILTKKANAFAGFLIWQGNILAKLRRINKKFASF